MPLCPGERGLEGGRADADEWRLEGDGRRLGGPSMGVAGPPTTVAGGGTHGGGGGDPRQLGQRVADRPTQLKWGAADAVRLLGTGAPLFPLQPPPLPRLPHRLPCRVPPWSRFMRCRTARAPQDTKRGFWTGTHCDVCTDGYLEPVCRARNVAISRPREMPAITQAADTTAQSTIVSDEEYQLLYTGGQPMLVLDTNDNEIVARFSLGGIIRSGAAACDASTRRHQRAIRRRQGARQPATTASQHSTVVQ